MKVADEVWTSVALLHTENPIRADFAVEEIKARAKRENWPIRQGFNVHVSYHCLANRPANPADHRMLHEDSRGRRRLYRRGDPCHSEREQGKIRPDKQDLLPQYQSLVDWYDSVYSKQEPLASSTTGSGNGTAVVPSETSSSGMPTAVLGGIQPTSGPVFVNAAGAVVIPDVLRRELGIKEGSCVSIYREQDRLVLQPVTEEFIHSLVGCCKGEDSLVEARERQHRMEK
jgi:AbrB family looped-hinge helix DNA binding protein